MSYTIEELQKIIKSKDEKIKQLEQELKEARQLLLNTGIFIGENYKVCEICKKPINRDNTSGVSSSLYCHCITHKCRGEDCLFCDDFKEGKL